MPFEWYLKERKIIEILRQFKKDTTLELEKMLEAKDHKRKALALEILMHFSDSELLHLYTKGLNDKNDYVRMYAIKALAVLDTADSIKLIEDRFLQEDFEIQKFIITTMGAYSANSEALDFVSKTKELKIAIKMPTEINEAISKIKERINARKK